MAAPDHQYAADGTPPRRLAFEAVADVLRRRTPLDEALEAQAGALGITPRDEALARAIATVSLRRFGTLRKALEERLAKGLPGDPRLLALLVVGGAQILFLKVPDHAAVDTAVRLAQDARLPKAFGGLVNAVLRRIARERDAILAASDPLALDTPDWLARRWRSAYGEEGARRIAEAHAREAALDLTVKGDPAAWAARLNGTLLPTGSVRLSERTPVRELDGFEEGEWWVQDTAASLPARLLAPRPGERIADLCAAPGGKTAQLASAGAEVLAVDRSPKRLERLAENMRRMRLSVETRAADVLDLDEPPFDAVLLDAPCSATGTIRRHPDVAWTKQEDEVGRLARLQSRLLDKAATLVRPGGRLVFCTCSIEPEEGEGQIGAFLARHPAFARRPARAEEVGGLPEIVNGEGDLRTLPFHLSGEGEVRGGMDGFFVARLVRAA